MVAFAWILQDCPGMSKRIATAFVWSLVGWTFGSMGVFFLSLPGGSEIILSLGLAVLAWDPTGRLWGSGHGRQPSPVAEIQGSSRLAAE
jgi:hypothetical protein